MLAAAEALGNASVAGNYSRRLAFAALAGEPWGLMGSRRLLWQMHAGDPSVHGLRLDAVEQARFAASHFQSACLTIHWSAWYLRNITAGMQSYRSSCPSCVPPGSPLSAAMHATGALQAATCDERDGGCAQVVELGQVGRAGSRGGARTLFVHHQRGPEWGNGTQLAAALKAAAAGAQGIAARLLASSCTCPALSLHVGDMM